jgi:hypothetical protein
LASLGSKIQCCVEPVLSLHSTPDQGWLIEGDFGVNTTLEPTENIPSSSHSFVHGPFIAPVAPEGSEPLMG